MSFLKKWFVFFQYVIPHHAVSRLVGYLAHHRHSTIKTWLISRFVRAYNVNLEEALEPNITAYLHFADFFTRAIRPERRPITDIPHGVACPADGCISQYGQIEKGCLIQAKGKYYNVEQLLGGSTERSALFSEGCFITIYLSPRDYHRLHMPISGVLQEMIYVPGRLFSVNHVTTDTVPDLFARNERVVAIFTTDAGPMALVLVGALLVASIETVWHGTVTPPRHLQIQTWNYASHPITLERGAEMGRFNMGSTIIVLFGKEVIRWRDSLASGLNVHMGEIIGHTQAKQSEILSTQTV